MASPTSTTTLPDYRLQISRYDRVSSLLIALLILLGLAVLILLIIWLTNRIFLGQAAVPVELVQLGDGTGGLGGGMELEQPPAEEIGLETDLPEPAVEETLAAISEAVGTRAAMLDNPAFSEQLTGGKSGGSHGDGRMPGNGSGGSGVRRHWELHFLEGNTLKSYAKQLDYFGIELGVLLPEGQVAYASQLAQNTPTTRIGPADAEQRYYLTWRDGELQRADRELLGRAEIQTAGRVVLKFLPPKVETHLAGLEKAYAGDRADSIRKTEFAIRPDGDGYQFYVLKQSYQH